MAPLGVDPTRYGKQWRSRAALGLGAWPSEVIFALAKGGYGRRCLAIGHTAGPGSDEPVLYLVGLTPTPCPFGGRRWWFRCPLVVDGEPCGRRCRILYRPLGARYFACRVCWRLTYPCRQLHRNFWFEATQAFQVLDEIAVSPRPRSPQKRMRRFEQAVRANGALGRFAERLRARVAKSER